MTPSPQIHNGGPTEDVLFDFVAGRLHPQAAEWIESHLDSCARCTGAVERVRQVREALEAPAESPFARQAAINAVRRRLEDAAARAPLLAAGGVADPGGGAGAVGGLQWLRPHANVPSLAPLLASRGTPAPMVLTMREGSADLEVGDEHAVAQSKMSVPLGGVLAVKPESRVVAEWSGARVVFDGGTRGARAQLQSSGSENRTLKLEHGRVVLDVDPLKPGSTLAVLTDDALVTVHGTRFLVERGAGGTLVAVERGRVRVASAGRVVELKAGTRLAPSATAPSALEPDDVRSFTQLAEELAAPEAPLTETLDVFADVASAEVSVDGVAHGRAPLSLAVAPGVHRVHVTAANRLPVEERVQVAAGAPTVFNAELPELRSGSHRCRRSRRVATAALHRNPRARCRIPKPTVGRATCSTKRAPTFWPATTPAPRSGSTCCCIIPWKRPISRARCCCWRSRSGLTAARSGRCRSWKKFRTAAVPRRSRGWCCWRSCSAAISAIRAAPRRCGRNRSGVFPAAFSKRKRPFASASRCWRRARRWKGCRPSSVI